MHSCRALTETHALKKNMLGSNIHKEKKKKRAFILNNVLKIENSKFPRINFHFSRDQKLSLMRSEPSGFRIIKYFKDDTQTSMQTSQQDHKNALHLHICLIYIYFIGRRMPALVRHSSFHVLYPSVHTPSPKLIQFVHSCQPVDKMAFILIFPNAFQAPQKSIAMIKAQSLPSRTEHRACILRLIWFLQMEGPKDKHEVIFLEVDFIKVFLVAFPLESNI